MVRGLFGFHVGSVVYLPRCIQCTIKRVFPRYKLTMPNSPSTEFVRYAASPGHFRQQECSPEQSPQTEPLYVSSISQALRNFCCHLVILS